MNDAFQPIRYAAGKYTRKKQGKIFLVEEKIGKRVTTVKIKSGETDI